MDKTAKKCIVWAIVCFIVAAIIHPILPLSVASMGGEPVEFNFFFGIVEPILAFIQGVFFAIGGAFVGAAVVVNWLASRASVATTHLL